MTEGSENLSDLHARLDASGPDLDQFLSSTVGQRLLDAMRIANEIPLMLRTAMIMVVNSQEFGDPQTIFSAVASAAQVPTYAPLPHDMQRIQLTTEERLLPLLKLIAEAAVEADIQATEAEAREGQQNVRDTAKDAPAEGIDIGDPE